MKAEPTKPKGFIGSLNCAIEGILWAVKTQRHMLFHLVAAILVLVGALVLRLTLHEFAHAWTANQFGDDTPRLYGRLTLNPLAHLDIMGSLMLVLVLREAADYINITSTQIIDLSYIKLCSNRGNTLKIHH